MSHFVRGHFSGPHDLPKPCPIATKRKPHAKALDALLEEPFLDPAARSGLRPWSSTRMASTARSCSTTTSTSPKTDGSRSSHWAGPTCAQAWNSSFSPFPSNRPLAQLSFGINHALAGLNPWAFKATNLAIHLLIGLLVFVFTRLAYRAVAGDAADRSAEPAGRGDRRRLAAPPAARQHRAVHGTAHGAAVQPGPACRAELLFPGAAADRRGPTGRSSGCWRRCRMALLAFSAKRTRCCCRLLLLVSEITLLRSVCIDNRHAAVFMQGVWAVFIALPLIAGLVYFATHPGYVNYDGRPFTLEERVLTQTRVLWLYLRWLFVPDVSAFGLFHDDIRLSTGLIEPADDAVRHRRPARPGAAALLLRRGHLSSPSRCCSFSPTTRSSRAVFPLEMVFEHRNYLASLGPLFYLAYLVTVRVSKPRDSGRWPWYCSACCSCQLCAWLPISRVDNWSSYKSFILSSAENHPRSPRSNFMAGQVADLCVREQPKAKPADLAKCSSRHSFSNGLAHDGRCINCLFGLLVLDLHLNKPPDPAVTSQRLKQTLRSGYVGPTRFPSASSAILVKWLQSGSRHNHHPRIWNRYSTPPSRIRNWNHTGRAGIEAAYRKYFEFVAQDLDAAVQHATAAVDAWPSQWSYHMQLVQVLQKLGRDQEALVALERAAGAAANESQQQQTAERRAEIATHRPH